MGIFSLAYSDGGVYDAGSLDAALFAPAVPETSPLALLGPASLLLVDRAVRRRNLVS